MKRTLSLILAVVMVALMIPFAAITTSAADASANKVEFDESKYTPIYSLDFTTITDPTQLEAAGWYTKEGTAKGSFESEYFVSTSEGVEFHTYNKNYFALEAVEFNDTDDYVVEFTTKMPSLRKRLIMAFADNPIVGNDDGKYDVNNWCLRDDRNSTTGVLDYGLMWKGGEFYTDATYSTSYEKTSDGASLRDHVSEEAYEAVANNADVTIKIFVTAGTANYIVMSIEGFGDFYVYDSKVSFGKTFHFTSRDGYGNDRYVVFQNFTVYKAGESTTPALDLTANLTAGETSYNAATEGIRFTTTIGAADLQKFVDYHNAGTVAKVEVGTLITTKAWADAAGKVSFEALDAIKGDKTAYVAVMATIGDFYAENTYAGTIGNAKADREYVAVGFVKVTLADGSVAYSYSAATTATLASVQG